MKVYTTDIKHKGFISKVFSGFVFHRVEDDILYLKCSRGTSEKIESCGIELTFKEDDKLIKIK